MPKTDYETIARAWRGDIWRPHFEVSREADGHYWKDLAANGDDWRGPYRTNRAAWKAICDFFKLA